MSADLLGLVVVPSCIFLLGVIGMSVRGLVRFTQYMIRSEESLDKIAVSNQQLADRLEDFMERSHTVQADHEGRIIRLEVLNGYKPKAHQTVPAGEP